MPDQIKITRPLEGLVLRANQVTTLTLGMGQQGPPGAAGAAGYNHTQASASATWTIAHNLGFRPSVQVRNSAGQVIVAAVEDVSVNVVQVSLTSALAGTARCL